MGPLYQREKKATYVGSARSMKESVKDQKEHWPFSLLAQKISIGKPDAFSFGKASAEQRDEAVLFLLEKQVRSNATNRCFFFLTSPRLLFELQGISLMFGTTLLTTSTD